MRYSVQNYSTGRLHRLAFVPEIPGTVTEVMCQVFPPPGDTGENVGSLQKLHASLFTMDYQFRHLGDYFFILEADGVVTNVLKAVVEQ